MLLRVLLPLGILLIAVLVLLCRFYSRILRDRTNLRLSRDRANADLQLLAHRVQRAQTQPDDLASQSDLWSERRYTPLRGATVVSIPPGPPSSSAASSAAVASQPPTTAPTGPTSSSKGKAKGKRKAEACKAEVPLSWAEADRQFYASAAGKAYLAASALADLSTAPSSSAVPTSSVVVANDDGSTPAPAPLAIAKKKAVKRRFTSEGVEIHHLLAGPARVTDVSMPHAGNP